MLPQVAVALLNCLDDLRFKRKERHERITTQLTNRYPRSFSACPQGPNGQNRYPPALLSPARPCWRGNGPSARWALAKERAKSWLCKRATSSYRQVVQRCKLYQLLDLRSQLCELLQAGARPAAVAQRTQRGLQEHQHSAL